MKFQLPPVRVSRGAQPQPYSPAFAALIRRITLLVACLVTSHGAIAEADELAQAAALHLAMTPVPAGAVPKFGCLELTLDLAATYDNPFDPAQIDVEANLIAPSGRRYRVAGFLDQPFQVTGAGSTLRASPAGPPVWKVRLCPTESGEWSYAVTATDKSGTVTWPAAGAAHFTVTDAPDKGFVGVSDQNRSAFAFRDGTPFVPIGENMGWGLDFDKWLPALSAAGGNFVRIWMCSWHCGLEWSTQSGSDATGGNYPGLGRYSLANAWRLDQELDLAKAQGIYVQLCLGTYSELSTEGGFFNNAQWKDNPYNSANGGPCATPADFFTDSAARKLYQQRLRYIAARYGWRDNIAAWELWNEANAPAPWVQEMASYLKGDETIPGANPYRHMVSTTYGDDAVWKLKAIDYTQTHAYGDGGSIPDHAPVAIHDAQQFASYGKPHLMSEFGIDWRAPDTKYDPAGAAVNLHNGVWASALSGDAGAASVWWWDSYVHPLNLYPVIGAVGKFMAGVHWTRGNWRPLTIDTLLSTDANVTWTDLDVPADLGWGKADTTEFTVGPAGLSGDAEVPEFLYSDGKPELRTTPTFMGHFEHPGRFVVHVVEVSASGTLHFALDGQPVSDVPLSAAPPTDPAVKPDYLSTELQPHWHVYQAKFDKDYGIEVPAGDHRVTLSNESGDWIQISGVRLTGYRSSAFPNVNVCGETNGQEAILWVQNAAHNWRNVAAGATITPIHELRLTVRGLRDGRYAVEWWDTANGVPASSYTEICKVGILTLGIPDIATDVAAHITEISLK